MYISVHIGMCTRIYVFIFHSCNLRALYASFLNGGEQSSARRGAASASVQCHHNKPTRQGQTGRQEAVYDVQQVDRSYISVYPFLVIKQA